MTEEILMPINLGKPRHPVMQFDHGLVDSMLGHTGESRQTFDGKRNSNRTSVDFSGAGIVCKKAHIVGLAQVEEET